jgi:hypothetical protein
MLRLGHQHANVLADHFIGGISKELCCGQIKTVYDTPRINDDDTVDCALDDGIQKSTMSLRSEVSQFTHICESTHQSSIGIEQRFRGDTDHPGE